VAAALQVVVDAARELREADSPFKLDLPVEFCFVRASTAALLSPICAIEPGGRGWGERSRRGSGEAVAFLHDIAGPGDETWHVLDESNDAAPPAIADQQLFLAIELPARTGGAVDGGFRATIAPTSAAGVGMSSASVTPRLSSAAPSSTFGARKASAQTEALAAVFARVEAGWRAISPLAVPQLGSIFGMAPHGTDMATSAGPRPFVAHVARSAIAPERRALFCAKMRELDPEGIFSAGRDWVDLLLRDEEQAAAQLG